MSDPTKGLPPDLDPIQRPADWELLYAREDPDRLPWTWKELDPDVDGALRRLGPLRGRLLDIGTGSGAQAIALARLGFAVTATDISASAIARARVRAAQQGVRVDFRQDDIVASTITETFDVVLDRGCFHVLAPGSRPDYVETVRALLEPGGHLLLKCFSVLEDGEGGPHRFTRSELGATFDGRFELIGVADTTYQGTLDRFPHALFAVLRRP